MKRSELLKSISKKKGQNKMQLYVFIGFQYEYSKVCLGKYLHSENAYFYEGTGKSTFANKLQKLHCCESVNKYIDLPMKSIWFQDFEKLKIRTHDKVCFIFSKSQSWLLQYKNGCYIELLRKKYPTCKIVLFLWDLISSFYKFDVAFFKQNCDAILTYDSGDARRYGLIYCSVPYSYVEIAENPEISKFDVYFCGRAKDRLQDIYRVYEYLKQNQMSCRFFITGVPVKEQRYKEDITYNKTLSYYSNLQYLQKARFVLEIVQKGSKGETLRVKEAVTYGKKIITNNTEMKNNGYYSPKNVCVYEKVKDINSSFLHNSNEAEYKGIEFNQLEEVLRKICK